MHGLLESKQLAFENCIIENFKIILMMLSQNVSTTGRPVILYTALLDDVNDYGEQELAIVNENFVVIQVITFGGYIPIGIQHQRVFTFEEFSKWIYNRSTNLFNQCIDTLDQVLCSIS